MNRLERKLDRCYIPISVPWKSTGNFRDLHIWLIDHIDDKNYTLGGIDLFNDKNRMVYFAYEDDAITFKLIWS